MEYRIREVEEHGIPKHYYPEYKSERMLSWRSGSRVYSPETAERVIEAWIVSMEKNFEANFISEKIIPYNKR